MKIATELFIANDGGNSVLVFDATASGECRAVAGDQRNSEHGPQSDRHLPRQEEQRTVGGELRQPYLGRVQPRCQWRCGAVCAWSAALRRISRCRALGNPHPIAYDTKREQILVPN